MFEIFLKNSIRNELLQIFQTYQLRSAFKSLSVFPLGFATFVALMSCT